MRKLWFKVMRFPIVMVNTVNKIASRITEGVKLPANAVRITLIRLRGEV